MVRWFVLRQVLSKGGHAMLSSSTVPVFHGIPTYFLAIVRDIRSRRIAAGYDHAGYHLALHLMDVGQIPYDAELDEWENQVKVLDELLAAERLADAINWFLVRFPQCMIHVPKRRRVSFLHGVIQCRDDRGLL
jgi:hypothetical protein